MDASGWWVAIDRGGTFTDVVAFGPGGERLVRKVLSTQAGEAQVLERWFGDGARHLAGMRVGTTVATNALLCGTGVPTALIVTRGHGDLLSIGHQSRPSIFALQIQRPEPLVRWVVEVNERIWADGQVEVTPDLDALGLELDRIAEEGCQAVAVALAHGYLHPQHEQEVARLARTRSFSQVTCSHDVDPRIGLVDRARSSAADASLSPVLRAYTETVDPLAPEVRYMRSTGGLCSGARFFGRDAVLSGPAGGVVACAALARGLGRAAVLGFDMGGTSTDISRWAGRLERRDKLEVEGRVLRLPGLDISTVAAGGGSILRLADGRAQVGPDSAGAMPGPAAAGRGGPATVTDANLVLGRVRPEYFPEVFGLEGNEPLSLEAARTAIQALDPERGVEELAAGFLAVANEAMVDAIEELSTARGHDPKNHSLIAFGGAAPQHACAVAEALGIEEVLVPGDAGVFSAAGIGQALLRSQRCLALMRTWESGLEEELTERLDAARVAAFAELLAEGAGPETLRAELRWDLRYSGAETALTVSDRQEFEEAHCRLFGFARPGVAVEVVQVRVEASALLGIAQEGAGETGLRGETPPVLSAERGEPPGASAESSIGEPAVLAVHTLGLPAEQDALETLACPWLRAESLVPGQRLEGPCVVAAATTTVVLDPGWSASVAKDGLLILHRAPRGRDPVSGKARFREGGAVGPVELELAHRRLFSIATRMGERLRRVAWSTNIKERLDFSCALFDAEGHLVANAPHIPVHLGAMGETVRGLLAKHRTRLRPAQAWAHNDPGSGGSHLPDITVISPVFDPEGLLFAFVASRGHHADVGGITPGSMPPFSVALAEEGVLLQDLLLLEDGQFREEEIREALAAGPHPVRDPQTVVADLAAQIASNQFGAGLLLQLAKEKGLVELEQLLSAIQDNGAAVVQSWLATLGSARYCRSDRLDDGTELQVALWTERDSDAETGEGALRLVVDFAGTGGPSPTNLNAPRAVVRAAVLYVVRCLLGRDLPLNEGCLRAVDLRIPEGSLLDPGPAAAVVGGNVETSQRIVDLLFGALGALAASQGTMNNLSFGNAGFGYYETIGGGSGAGPGFCGASGVHSHMTNTRMTDAEVLERRYPVLVRRFELRRGSGGSGRWVGGDGICRELEFRASLDVSLLSQRRTTHPFGLRGGGAAQPGRATLYRAKSKGEAGEALSGSFRVQVEPGDRLVLETPGGGGYGSPRTSDAPEQGEWILEAAQSGNDTPS